MKLIVRHLCSNARCLIKSPSHYNINSNSIRSKTSVSILKILSLSICVDYGTKGTKLGLIPFYKTDLQICKKCIQKLAACKHHDVLKFSH